MGEDFDNHRRIFDRGNDLQGSAVVRAVFDVDVEAQLMLAVRVIACGRGCLLWRIGNDFTALCVRRQHAMPDRRQRSKTLDIFFQE